MPNFFFSDCGAPTFKELEAPITEYATLSFIEDLFISNYHWYTLFIKTLIGVIRNPSFIYSLGANLFRSYNNPNSSLYQYDWILNYRQAKSHIAPDSLGMQRLAGIYQSGQLHKQQILQTMHLVMDEAQ